MPNVYTSEELIRRAYSWLNELGLKSAEVNLVAFLAEFATAQLAGYDIQHELLVALATETWPSLESWAKRHGVVLNNGLYMNARLEAINVAIDRAKQ